MKFCDKISAAAASGNPVALKGHAKITLTDTVTGEKEVHESDNIITGAVASVLAQNISGLGLLYKLFPLKKLYSGCLLFQNEIQATAENYNIPSETANPCKANAGDTAAATQSDTRGNPNAAESEETDTSLKQVWDWPTSAGNGTIRTVCLVPGATLGNMGTKPIDNTLNAWETIAVQDGTANNIPNRSAWTRNDALHFPISMDANGQTGTAVIWSGTTFEEVKIRKDVSAFGILRNKDDVSEISSRTATVRSFTDNKANIFEDPNYYYLYEIIYDSQAAKYGLKIDKVSKEDMTVTQADIYYDGITLWTGNQYQEINKWRRAVPRWAYDGTYLYLPNSSANGFVAVNPNDNGDKIIIDGTVTIQANSSAPNSKSLIRPLPISPGVIYGENYLINGGTVYEIAWTTPAYYNNADQTRYNPINTIRNGAGVWAYPYKISTRGDEGQGPILLSFFLSTIMVLQSPVQKGPTQTMKLEYTLTEVAPQS